MTRNDDTGRTMGGMKTKIVPELLINDDGSMHEDCIVRLKMVQIIEGEELVDFMKERIQKCINELKEQLFCYDTKSIFSVWFYFVRQVEEFINVYYELGRGFVSISKHIHIGNDCEMKLIISVIEDTFGQNVLARFQELVSLFVGFTTKELIDNQVVRVPIETLYDMWDYLQKRRLHIMTILNLIPMYANGDKAFGHEEIRNKTVEWIERILMNITLGCHAIMESKCLPDFHGEMTLKGVRFSHHYSHLEDMFMEPQRLTILDLEKYRSIRFEERRCKETLSICSLEEFDITLYNDTLYYERYGLLDNKKYQSLVAFMNNMKGYFKDDYLIEVPHADFVSICQQYKELDLYREMDDFYDIQNSRYGFVRVEDTYYSTYFMLIRYYVNYIEKLLRRNKRYQIDSGFIFEDKVKEIAEKYGFDVKRGCKRIDHREFDVVCIKDDTIYNFQCKNNYMSVSSIGIKESVKASRYNRRLVSYYEKALKDEFDKEHHLVEKLGVDKIKHFVISRFPVITDNENIIPFNRLEEWMLND